MHSCSGLGGAAVYFYSHERVKRYLSLLPLFTHQPLYHEDSRGTPHANTSLLALCEIWMTSSYRNARGAAIYSQEDQTVHCLIIKAQRGRSGLSLSCVTLLQGSVVVGHSAFSSVQFSRSVVSDSLRPHESQHARPPCPSPSPGVHSDSRPSSP